MLSIIIKCLSEVKCDSLLQFSVRTVENLNYVIDKNPLNWVTPLIRTVSVSPRCPYLTVQQSSYSRSNLGTASYFCPEVAGLASIISSDTFTLGLV